METLVNMAKRLGIFPKANMSRTEQKQIFQQLTEEIKKKIPPTYRKRVSCGSFWMLQDAYYTLCKKVERKIENPKQLEQNYAFFKQLPKGIKAPSQYGFLWHDATEKYPLRERFVADIQLDSPHFPEVIKKLDAFILKYKAQFKITEPKHTDRSDTLNMYLPYDITPKIATEFIQIIRPCLSEKYDDYLNGMPLTLKGKTIKGIRIGPEYSPKTSQNTTPNIERIKKDLGIRIGLTDLDQGSSLGEKAATVEILNLAYYLAGKEGQNPFQLLGFNGQPYRKSLEIAPLPEPQKEKTTLQGLLLQLSSIRNEMKVCQSEIQQLTLEQKRIQERLIQKN